MPRRRSPTLVLVTAERRRRPVSDTIPSKHSTASVGTLLSATARWTPNVARQRKESVRDAERQRVIAQRESLLGVAAM